MRRNVRVKEAEEELQIPNLNRFDRYFYICLLVEEMKTETVERGSGEYCKVVNRLKVKRSYSPTVRPHGFISIYCLLKL